MPMGFNLMTLEIQHPLVGVVTYTGNWIEWIRIEDLNYPSSQTPGALKLEVLVFFKSNFQSP